MKTERTVTSTRASKVDFWNCFSENIDLRTQLRAAERREKTLIEDVLKLKQDYAHVMSQRNVFYAQLKNTDYVAEAVTHEAILQDDLQDDLHGDRAILLKTIGMLRLEQRIMKENHENEIALLRSQTQQQEEGFENEILAIEAERIEHNEESAALRHEILDQEERLENMEVLREYDLRTKPWIDRKLYEELMRTNLAMEATLQENDKEIVALEAKISQDELAIERLRSYISKQQEENDKNREMLSTLIKEFQESKNTWEREKQANKKGLEQTKQHIKLRDDQLRFFKAKQKSDQQSITVLNDSITALRKELADLQHHRTANHHYTEGRGIDSHRHSPNSSFSNSPTSSISSAFSDQEYSLDCVMAVQQRWEAAVKQEMMRQLQADEEKRMKGIHVPTATELFDQRMMAYGYRNHKSWMLDPVQDDKGSPALLQNELSTESVIALSLVPHIITQEFPLVHRSLWLESRSPPFPAAEKIRIEWQ